ncbi:MAG: hypothetical protein FWH04_04990 [Oscillospiraceae bacterium]|nr:hypothetical protein [Oscillospiraceae bacterium]
MKDYKGKGILALMLMLAALCASCDIIPLGGEGIYYEPEEEVRVELGDSSGSIEGESTKPLSREYLFGEWEQRTYDAILNALHDSVEKISFTMPKEEYDIVSESLGDILSWLSAESVILPANNIPNTQWVHTYNPFTRNFTLEVPAEITREDYVTRYRRAIDKAREIISETVPMNAGEMEAARLLYEYVIENTVYSLYREDEPGAAPCTAYDTLVRGEAQCEGFAKAIVMLYSLIGVECAVVTAEGEGTLPGHAWNLAVIDGEQYYIDCTNASDSEISLPGAASYGFCMTDEYMEAVDSYNYNSQNPPTFGVRVPLRSYLPENKGSGLKENPYWTPDVAAGEADLLSAVQKAFKKSVDDNRGWIWLKVGKEELLKAGVFTDAGDNGSYIQNVLSPMPPGYSLHWEWTDKMSTIFLREE